jgi:hypothetical protein
VDEYWGGEGLRRRGIKILHIAIYIKIDEAR